VTLASDFRQVVDATLRIGALCERGCCLNMKRRRAQRRRVARLGAMAARNLADAYRPDGACQAFAALRGGR